jgi:hypothetical protein
MLYIQYKCTNNKHEFDFTNDIQNRFHKYESLSKRKLKLCMSIKVLIKKSNQLNEIELL